MLDLASHNALVTGEWYIPGQRLIGLRIEEPASKWGSPESEAGVLGSGSESSDAVPVGDEEESDLGRANAADLCSG